MKLNIKDLGLDLGLAWDLNRSLTAYTWNLTRDLQNADLVASGCEDMHS